MVRNNERAIILLGNAIRSTCVSKRSCLAMSNWVLRVLQRVQEHLWQLSRNKGCKRTNFDKLQSTETSQSHSECWWRKKTDCQWLRGDRGAGFLGSHQSLAVESPLRRIHNQWQVSHAAYLFHASETIWGLKASSTIELKVHYKKSNTNVVFTLWFQKRGTGWNMTR